MEITCALIWSNTRSIATEVDDCSFWTHTTGCTILEAVELIGKVLSMILTGSWTRCSTFCVNTFVHAVLGTAITSSPANMNIIIFAVMSKGFERSTDTRFLSFRTVFSCSTVITFTSFKCRCRVQSSIADFEGIEWISYKTASNFSFGNKIWCIARFWWSWTSRTLKIDKEPIVFVNIDF